MSARVKCTSGRDANDKTKTVLPRARSVLDTRWAVSAEVIPLLRLFRCTGPTPTCDVIPSDIIVLSIRTALLYTTAASISSGGRARGSSCNVDNLGRCQRRMHQQQRREKQQRQRWRDRQIKQRQRQRQRQCRHGDLSNSPWANCADRGVLDGSDVGNGGESARKTIPVKLMSDETGLTLGLALVVTVLLYIHLCQPYL